MAKTKPEIVHMLDKTIGMDSNEDITFCGKSKRLLRNAVVVDPHDDGMPALCEAADNAGRMCPDCKRGVTFYSKGITLGETRASQQIVKGLMDKVSQHLGISGDAGEPPVRSKMSH